MEIEDEGLKSHHICLNFKSNDEVETDCINQELRNPGDEVYKEIPSSDASKVMELKLNNPSDYNSSPNEQADYVTKKTNDNGTRRQLTCKLCGEEFGKKKQLKQHLTERKS